MQRHDLAADDLQAAATYWGDHGEPDKCAETLAKAAVELEGVDGDKAAALHKRGNALKPPTYSFLSKKKN